MVLLQGTNLFCWCRHSEISQDTGVDEVVGVLDVAVDVLEVHIMEEEEDMDMETEVDMVMVMAVVGAEAVVCPSVLELAANICRLQSGILLVLIL